MAAQARLPWSPPSPTAVAGALAVVLSAVVLAGWIARVPALVQIYPGLAVMQANTALGFAVAGVGLVALGYRRDRAAMICGAVVTVFFVLVLAEHVTGMDLAVDWLVVHPFMSDSFSAAGRTSAISSLAFVLAGVALMLCAGRLPTDWLLPTAGSVSVAVVAAALIGAFGYLVASVGDISARYLEGMAVHTAAGFLALGLGLTVYVWKRVGLTWRAPAKIRGLAAAPPARRIWGFLVLGFGAFLASISLLLLGMAQSRQANGWVLHSMDVMLDLQRMDTTMVDRDTALRGFLISGDEQFLAAYNDGEGAFQRAFKRVREETSDNPAQQQRMLDIAPLERLWDEHADGMLKQAGQGNDLTSDETLAQFSQGKTLMDNLRREIAQALAGEIQLLHDREGRQAATQLWLTLIMSMCVIAGGGICAALFALARRIDAQRLQLEAQVHRSETLNEELDAFSYSVSHDLRQPLRGMTGFSEILLEEYAPKLDAQGKDYLLRISAAAERMGRLIDDLLTLSRVSRGALNREDVDLTAMAQAAVAELQAGQPQRRVAVEIEPDLHVNADPRYLRSLLQNLIGNAWKFTGRREGGRIEIGREPAADDPVFFVRDNGAGFDMAHAKQLFGAFQRLHSPEEFPGTGVGLAIVHRIVNRHGGHVWAEGVKGQGATFHFTLTHQRSPE